MRSRLIEFHRFGALETGLLRKGDRYLIASANSPVREYSMAVDQIPFLRLMQGLRYQASATPREQALHEVSELVTAALSDQIAAAANENGDLELDVVVNAAEVAALPFEMIRDPDGRPILAQRGRCVELARRVRQEGLAGASAPWPVKPRVLFAWAEPFGVSEVPHAEHEAALRAALEPWLPFDDESGVLTVLGRADVEQIKQCCDDAVANKRPFTHVHMLAHGYPVGKGWDQRFGIALHRAESENLIDAVVPERLSDALAALKSRPVMLTLAACDSANSANPVIPERSVAHELHVSGFPVVIASQLPLTKAGSTVFVEHFYRELFRGADVRKALHQARCALFETPDAEHDWGSVVAYIRLPEGYSDHLVDVRLAQVLESMKAIQNRSDRLIASGTAPADEFRKLMSLLQDRLETLESFLDDPEYRGRRELQDENLGLLGSAEKRIAELHWRLGDLSASRAGLQRSSGWYRKAYRGNISHHWTGVQFLSLEAVLTGRIAKPEFWHACRLAAELDCEKAGEFWAFGSLAELNLLASIAGAGENLPGASAAIAEMKRRVAEAGFDRFPLESTRRQLRRYAEWWTKANGYFPDGSDLSEPAARLAALLD